MFKKVFALASVTALTGLVAVVAASGCSSTTTVTDEGGTTVSEGGSDAKVPIEAAAEDAAVEPSTCPSTDPITAADIEGAVKWVPPAATQTVCTQQNIDDLKALFATGGGSAKFADIKTTLGATCGPCAFTAKTAANWGPIVEDTNGFLRNETGSCLAQLDGAACGKAAFNFDICLKVACPTADCGDAAAVTACQSKAAKGACKDLSAAVPTACPNLQADLDACGGIVDAIVVSCAGGPDAGIDASSP